MSRKTTALMKRLRQLSQSRAPDKMQHEYNYKSGAEKFRSTISPSVKVYGYETFDTGNGVIRTKRKVTSYRYPSKIEAVLKAASK